MSRPPYSMLLAAAAQRISAGTRFHAELEEQAQRRGRLSRRLGHVFAEMATQAANDQQWVENPKPMPAPSKAYKPAHGATQGEPSL